MRRASWARCPKFGAASCTVGRGPRSCADEGCGAGRRHPRTDRTAEPAPARGARLLGGLDRSGPRALADLGAAVERLPRGARVVPAPSKPRPEGLDRESTSGIGRVAADPALAAVVLADQVHLAPPHAPALGRADPALELAAGSGDELEPGEPRWVLDWGRAGRNAGDVELALGQLYLRGDAVRARALFRVVAGPGDEVEEHDPVGRRGRRGDRAEHGEPTQA